MKSNIKLSTIFGPIATVFKKYNLTIFIVVLVVGLGTAILLLNNALQKASQTNGYTPNNAASSSFDQATIDRVNQLHTSIDAPTNYTPPSGRINPFSE